MNNKLRRGSLLAIASAQVVEFDINNYLTIVALEDGLTASLSTNAVEYCVDGDENWTTLAAGATSPAINKGQTLSFRGNLTPASSTGVGTFKISKSCDLTGNCNSLLFGDNAKTNLSLNGKNYAFYNLFYNCTTIKNVSSIFLPATTLATQCYYRMFYNCTSLTTAPALPATTLKDSCYTYMFYGCSKLTTAPALPATTVSDYCYQYMFYNCTSLTTAPSILPAKTLKMNCYQNMFYGCSKLTTAPQLPATTLTSSCYYRMFYNCTSLTTAPALPATTLKDSCYYFMFYGTNTLPDCSNINFSSSTVVASGGLKGLFAGTKVTDSDLRNILPINSNGKYYLPCTTLEDWCYKHMFYGCSKLTTAPQLPATTLTSSCYYYMFSDCTSLTTAPALPATTLKDSCYYRMFANCKALTTAPELPATTLVSNCYYSMFSSCSKLNYIKAMFTTTPSSSYTNYWVLGVASSGTFVKNKNATWNVTGTSGIPSGWTVQTA